MTPDRITRRELLIGRMPQPPKPSPVPRVNLVIACWNGPRRNYTVGYPAMLQAQVETLSTVAHQLGQVTFVCNGDRLLADQAAAQLPNAVVLTRPNAGLSYGAWLHAFEVYGHDFEWYIFLEDDYVAVRPGFDRDLIDLFQGKPDCGYLCQLVHPGPPPICRITNGITSAAVLARVKKGYDAYLAYKSDRPYEDLYQNGWGSMFLEAGYRLEDTGERFRAPFLDYHHQARVFVMKVYHESQSDELFVPVEHYLRLPGMVYVRRGIHD